MIDASTAQTISQILAEGVAGTGGAQNAYVAGYRVAAKTGTSEKKGQTTTGEEMYICSCVGYAPADDPRVAVIIMVDEPSEGILYGSTVAAPYIAKTFESVLPYLGIEPQYTEEEVESIAKQIPSYVGLPTQNAKAYAESRGLVVEVVGDGAYVTSQSPKANNQYSGNVAKIILYTNGAEASDGGMVPNVVGMTALDANLAIASAGFNIRFEGAYDGGRGEAIVATQYPAAGSVATPGSVVCVEPRYMKDTE